MSRVEPQYDPLLECLAVFSKLFNRPISIDALIAGLPIEPGKVGPELFSIHSSKGMFSRVARRAGFATRLIKRDLNQISELLLPCILLLKNRNACILESIDHNSGKAKVIFPEVGEGEDWIEIERLAEEYIGFAFLLKQEFKQTTKPFRLIKAKGSHWFWGTIINSKEIYFSVILASLLINIFIIATPLFTMNVYDRVVPNSAIETLWVLTVGMIVIFIFDTSLRYMRTYLLEVAGKKCDIIMSSIYLNKYST